MRHARNLGIGATFVAVFGGLLIAQSYFQHAAAVQAQNAVMAPRFEVDPNWPKPLPNGWYQGQSIGVWADNRDHVWIVHRSDTLDDVEAAADKKTGDCCKAAPPILEFDQAGNLLHAWGGQDGPGYKWPGSNHGIHVDSKHNVWIGGNGPDDGLMLRFTEDGKFIKQYGMKGVKADSNSTEHFYEVAKMFFDEKGNEVYVADGYGNKRVVVVDPDTGVFKRFWGAYGNKPSDENTGRYDPKAPPIQQFRTPVHCADLSADNLLYVCDRTNDRLQVFTKEGKFVKEVFVARDSLGDGSVWDVAFSKDPQQKFLFLADGRSQKIRIFDRQSLTELTNFGKGGHYPGEWYSLHSMAIDTKGNLYTTETYGGRRVQRFVNKGLVPVTSKEQGVVWPRSTAQ